MPAAYGYARASTGRQDLTFDSQRSSIERYFKDKLEPAGYTWGGTFEDKAVSGGKPFTERPEGRNLWVTIQPGDALIWMKIDRAFRSVKDGANVLSLFRERGISIHSIDIGLDTSTPMGEFTMHLLILLAQLERSWVSSRTKEALAALKARGYRNIGYTIPAGFKRIGSAGDTKQVPDLAERAMIEQAYASYLAGDTLETISNRLYFQGKRRQRGTQYKPFWLGYAFRCHLRGWPKAYYFFQYQAEVKEKLAGRQMHPKAMRELMDREFRSGRVVACPSQLVDVGENPLLGNPAVAPLPPADRSE